MTLALQNPQLRFIAFQVVASTPDGHPIYSVADIIEPRSRRYCGQLLRSARKTAGFRGYVLVGRVPTTELWPEWEAAARKVGGL